MRKIRVANVPFGSSALYGGLQELDFVEYEENLPTENARKLHEHEVDVALLPTSEFAVHGAYLGLDFGLACEEESNLLTLFAHSDVSKLSTIYLYESSSSSALLLRLLLEKRCENKPRLVRTRMELGPDDLTESEGVLVRRAGLQPFHAEFPVAVDLVSEWHRLSGEPFVFLLWATRPGTLDIDQYRAFSDAFHRLVKAQHNSLSVAEEPVQMRGTVRYYLDHGVRASLNKCFGDAHRLNLLPEASYQSCTYTLLDQQPRRTVPEKPIGRLLQEIIEGRRIGVSEGIRLIKEAHIADLGMAADFIRRNFSVERSVSYLYQLRDKAGVLDEESESNLREWNKKGVQHVLVIPSDEALSDISIIENFLYTLKKGFPIEIEGLGVPQILQLSRSGDMSVPEVVSRLVTAGLDAVPAFGGGLLLDRYMSKRVDGKFYATDWIRAIKWVHRYGLKSSCSLVLSGQESWEDRLIHLHKLRALQDENPGFRYFYTEVARGAEKEVNAQERLKANIIGRLFLDNIPAVHQLGLVTDSLPSVLSLCMGSNEISLPVGDENIAHLDQALEVVHLLWDNGLDFHPEALRNPIRPNVH